MLKGLLIIYLLNRVIFTGITGIENEICSSTAAFRNLQRAFRRWGIVFFKDTVQCTVYSVQCTSNESFDLQFFII